MKTRLMESRQGEPRVARAAVILCVTMLVSCLSGEEAMAQGPFQRLRRSFDAIRPGWIIPHSSEDAANDSSESPKQKKSVAKSSKKSEDASKEPTASPAKGKEENSPQPALSPLPVAAENVDDPALLELIPPGAPDEFGATFVVEKDESVAIAEIDPDGAASAADLQVGDIIQNVGGISIGSVESLKGITDELSGGVVVAFEIVRDGKELKKDVQFGTVKAADMLEVTPATDNSTSPPESSISTPPVSKPQAIDPPNLQSVLAPNLLQENHAPTAVPTPRVQPTLVDFSTPSPASNAKPELDNSLEQLLDFDVDEAK